MRWIFGVVFVVMGILLTGVANSETQPVNKKISVLIVDGMNNHDWARNTRILKEILEESGRFTVDVSTSPPGDAPQAD